MLFIPTGGWFDQWTPSQWRCPTIRYGSSGVLGALGGGEGTQTSSQGIQGAPQHCSRISGASTGAGAGGGGCGGSSSATAGGLTATRPPVAPAIANATSRRRVRLMADSKLSRMRRIGGGWVGRLNVQ